MDGHPREEEREGERGRAVQEDGMGGEGTGAGERCAAETDGSSSKDGRGMIQPGGRRAGPPRPRQTPVFLPPLGCFGRRGR